MSPGLGAISAIFYR